MHVDYIGLLRSPVSWAHVGRELVLALDRLGVEVSVSQKKGDAWRGDFPLDDRLEELSALRPGREVVLAYDYPPNYASLKGNFKIGVLSYETSHLPARWVEAINSNLDLLVVPSQFVKETARGSGVRAEIIEVVPLGIDPEIFSPEGERIDVASEDRFVFLHFSSPRRSKGTGYVLNAFEEAFEPSDSVALVIKSIPGPPVKQDADPGEPKEIREDPVHAQVVSRLLEKGDPRIRTLDSALNPKDMGSLFRSVDCMVQPSMSEGFGLAMLEAMACGVPVIANNFGGHLDFAHNGNAFLLFSHTVLAMEAQYDMDDDPCFCRAMTGMPDAGHLADTMQYVFEHPEKAGQKAAVAMQEVSSMTWDASAKRLLEVIEKRLSARG